MTCQIRGSIKVSRAIVGLMLLKKQFFQCLDNLDLEILDNLGDSIGLDQLLFQFAIEHRYDSGIVCPATIASNNTKRPFRGSQLLHFGLGCPSVPGGIEF